MPGPPSQPVSALLTKWRAGDEEALQALIPLVYEELRRIAQYRLRPERPDHTLQTTALVHEAYLRLVKQGPAEVNNRAHFLAVGSQLMRQILVDHARSHRAGESRPLTKLRTKYPTKTTGISGNALISQRHQSRSRLERHSHFGNRAAQAQFSGSRCCQARITIQL